MATAAGNAVTKVTADSGVNAAAKVTKTGFSTPKAKVRAGDKPHGFTKAPGAGINKAGDAAKNAAQKPAQTWSEFRARFKGQFKTKEEASKVWKQYKRQHNIKPQSQQRLERNKNPNTVHGNSNVYKGKVHVYIIRNTVTGRVEKVGESAQGLTKAGLSRRAEQQARKLGKATGQEYRTEVRKFFNNKAEAREYETKLIQRIRKIYGDQCLPLNKGVR